MELRQWNNNKGFSLLELLIALTILAVGLLGLAGLQITAIKGNKTGFTVSTATSIAESRVEELQSLPSIDPDLAIAVNKDDGTQTVQGVVYTRRFDVLDDTPNAGMRTVNYRVTWTEDGIARTIRLSGTVRE